MTLMVDLTPEDRAIRDQHDTRWRMCHLSKNEVYDRSDFGDACRMGQLSNPAVGPMLREAWKLIVQVEIAE